MSLLNVGITGDGEAFAKFNWTEAATTFADEWGPKILTALRLAAPVAPDGGGRLRDALTFERHTSIGFLSMVFSDPVPYFPYVIEGTVGGQLIEPVAAQALHWTSGGSDVFASSVVRGDTPKNDFPTKVWSMMQETVQAAFKQVIREALTT
jgi:hypothetical protein